MSLPDRFGYLSCDSCGLRFYPSGEAPRDAYASEYFDQYGGGGYVQSEAQRRSEAKARLGLLPSPRPGFSRLLELGCAAGFFLDEARLLGWEVKGVEPSSTIASYARTAFGVDVTVGFVEDLDLTREETNVICAWHVIEHIPNPLELLRSLRGTLTESGMFVGEVPNGASLQARHEGDDWSNLMPDVHVAQWTPAGIHTLFERAGFSRTEVRTVPWFTYVGSPPARLWHRASQAVRLRRWVPEPHPTDHELLRVIATR